MISAMHAQVVDQGEAALVYYSPKTLVSLDFAYTMETQEMGIYAQYAESMLGATEVIKENKTTYSLTHVQIGTRTLTDYERPHKVTADAGIPLLLTINERGLLAGYNLPPFEKKPAPFRPDTCHKPGAKNRVSVAPYPEEVLTAANPLAQAHAVAKQIFHLRETRMYLLNGEVEHAPADGRAMQLVLAELDKQERTLTELFVGKKCTRTEHKRVEMLPEEQEELFFFSTDNGFTDAENIDADTIRANVVLHPQEFKPVVEDKKKKAKAPEVSPIVYNLPGSGDVKVVFDGRTLGSRTIPVAQIGVDVPLAKSVFSGAELPVIIFNEKTGNILSISK